ncbi:MAG: hypothetical protein ACJ8AI_11600 [Rhodopila sp.]
MTAETHFIQACDGPVFAGRGAGTLACACGQVLIEDYDPPRFLGVGIQCGRCAAVTTTPPLPADTSPPFAVVVAEPVAEPRTSTTMLPPSAYVIGRADYDRIAALYAPKTPEDTVYPLAPALLDSVASAYERIFGTPLPETALSADDPFAGIKEHALGWAVTHLRERMRAGDWTCRESATSAAGTHVAGFLHFLRTWSHHPLFPAMAATAGERGFALHGLALFAAAHCLTMQGNRIGFPTPSGFPGRIDHLLVATGPTETVIGLVEVFDRFEYPYGQPWDAAGLRAAVSDIVLASQSRINLKNPGLLLLSPGVALSGFDEALIQAVQAAVQAVGRRNRGLMAVAPMVLRMQSLPDPHALRFGYGLFPVLNRHYRGDSIVGAGN